MKIFLDINNKKVESENKSEPNYVLVRFKDIEIKDEFQEFSYKIVNNIEIKLNMKVKNKFNSAKVGNLFQKFQPTQNKKLEEKEKKENLEKKIKMKNEILKIQKENEELKNYKILLEKENENKFQTEIKNENNKKEFANNIIKEKIKEREKFQNLAYKNLEKILNHKNKNKNIYENYLKISNERELKRQIEYAEADKKRQNKINELKKEIDEEIKIKENNKKLLKDNDINYKNYLEEEYRKYLDEENNKKLKKYNDMMNYKKMLDQQVQENKKREIEKLKSEFIF